MEIVTNLQNRRYRTQSIGQSLSSGSWSKGDVPTLALELKPRRGKLTDKHGPWSWLRWKFLRRLKAKESPEAQKPVGDGQGQKSMEMLVNWHPTREISGRMEGSGRSQQLPVTQIGLIANFLALSAHIWAVTDIGWSRCPPEHLVLPRRYTAKKWEQSGFSRLVAGAHHRGVCVRG